MRKLQAFQACKNQVSALRWYPQTASVVNKRFKPFRLGEGLGEELGKELGEELGKRLN